MKTMPTEILILGTTYSVYRGDSDDFPALKNIDGYTDTSTKMIVVDNTIVDNPESKQDLNYYYRSVLRHEIIHAFLYESGMAENSNSADSWAVNEEMVDWMAIQFPKICKAFEDAGCMEDK